MGQKPLQGISISPRKEFSPSRLSQISRKQGGFGADGGLKDISLLQKLKKNSSLINESKAL
jgi:hypothetical protein